MDNVELEREKRITIPSGVMFCDWDAKSPATGEQYHRHPWCVCRHFSSNSALRAHLVRLYTGHVDFNIEVERALRVLDGPVLVLYAGSGVQVCSPARAYVCIQSWDCHHRVKRLLSTGKCGGITFLGYLSLTRWTSTFVFLVTRSCFCRPGANPWRVINQIRTNLRIPAAAVQVPIGVEDQLEGVVDLVG
jgi:elongation factor G